MIIMIENMQDLENLVIVWWNIKYYKKVNKDNLKFILDTGHANVSSYKIADYVYTLKLFISSTFKW